MAAPTTSEKKLLALGNEVLSNIVTQLNPPAAVCLALSCKHLKDVVEQVCGVDIGHIIPKIAWTTHEVPQMLQPYVAPRKEKRLFDRNKRIADTFTDLGLDDTIDLAAPFSLERIGLLNLLGYGSDHPSLCPGHCRHVARGSDYCVICTFLGLMDDEYEAGKSDEPEEMKAIGAITYGENGNVDQGGDEEDDNEYDHGDDGSALEDSEDGADDGPDPNESGLDDGDSITINTDSERSADEDDQVIENGNTTADGDTEMQDEIPMSEAPDDQDDRNDHQSDTAGEVAGDSKADAGEDDNGPSDDDDDSDPDSEDPDDESEDYEQPHIEKLSNELLAKVVPFLDPPSAVCFALTCKHMMVVVTTVCTTELNGICPKDIRNEPPAVLQKYEQCERGKQISKHFDMTVMARLEFIPNGSWWFWQRHELTHEYTGLLIALRKSKYGPPYTERSCLHRGHMKSRWTEVIGSAKPVNGCLICFFLEDKYSSQYEMENGF